MLLRFCLSWRKRLLQSSLSGRCRPIHSRLVRTQRPVVGLLEDRVLPSITLNFREFHDPSRIPAGLTPSAIGILAHDNGLPAPYGYYPSDIRTAYGIDKVMFGSVAGDGTGQTIAIVDAYDNPSFVNSTASGFSNSDLAQFDLQLGLPDPPSFTKVNQSGQASPLPRTDPAGAGNPNGNWEIEEALDVEWAHSVAPGANIILVEANSDSDSDLYTAVATAADLPGVSAVSMSWGENEFSTETSRDSTFVTPTGHQGVTFLAASGDSGGFAIDSSGNPTTTPGIDYPAASPFVVAVGGTTLQINNDSTYNSETAWSGSGGGTSLYENKAAYQQGVQTTNLRTTPDVAFDADPNTGVAVYDSYDNTDNSGPWIAVGGTSLAAPAWAGLIAIANQGRVLQGGGTLDGSSQTLPALYALSTMSGNDFHDITSGNNGVFSAGPGYDEVTGLGSPQAVDLTADLTTYGTANHIAVTSQPPSNIIAGDSFGIVVAAEDPAGSVDPAFNGTLTITLDQNHPGATLGGSLTATADDGVAVFDGLTLSQLGTGYTITVNSSKFASITTNSFAIISNPTPWQGTFYPVPTDASLRGAISQADSNGFAFNTILLSASTYRLSALSSGGLVIQNASSLPSKTLTITGQGQSSSMIGAVYNWNDRIFEIEGTSTQTTNVTIQNLTIEGGAAQNGGVLGGRDALGGGLLIDDANVMLMNVLLQGNQAQGVPGAVGAAGVLGAAGGAGGNGNNAKGGGIYLASGTLSLFNDTFNGNTARGGQGGAGGMGGGQGTKAAAAVTGGKGGAGGQGGSGAGGALYAAGGAILLNNDSFQSNQALGGAGGNGGSGGSGGHGLPSKHIPGKSGGAGGLGGAGGAAYGGGVYVGGGSITLSGTALQKNAAKGGTGGAGGYGGPGTAIGTTTAIFGGAGTTFGGGTGIPDGGGLGGDGGRGGAGGAASGGGVYVAKGSLTLVNTTLATNQAVGGQGGTGGHGGTGGFGSGVTPFLGLPTGKTGGSGGAGGHAGAGQGGGILVAGGTVTLYAVTLNANVASGGQGGAGGTGGSGPIAAVFGGTLGFTTGFTGGGGTGGQAKNTAGPGGNGGNGGTGKGAGVYVSGGALTLVNATVADNTASAGAAGSGAPGGRAGTGTLTGGKGAAGSAGDSSGGGLYVSGGTVKLDNSTLALNNQTGTGSGAEAVVQSGTVTAVSTLFAGGSATDYSGSFTATDCLVQTTPTSGSFSGSGNLIGVNPQLNSNGLQNNGGPTQTIALQSTSPAIGKGANPENLFADQRGSDPRTGSGGTDIGAYQTSAQGDTMAPTASLQATAVTSSNATTLNPYTFTITYSDNVAVSVATLSDVMVDVVPPGAQAPISASVQSVAAVGTADSVGNASAFIVTYQITPPGGSWTSADSGTYNIDLGGGAVTDLAGNAVASGSLGTFTVTISNGLVISPTTLTAAKVGVKYSKTLTASGGTAPYTFAVTAGSLPPGLTLSTTGVLSGTATAGGSFTFTVTATDSHSVTGSQGYSFTVNAATIAVKPSSLLAATAGAKYSATITASGGTAPYTFAVTAGSLPPGLTLSSTGALSGTPTAGGSFTFTVTATDSSTGTGPYSGSLSYTLTVNPAIITLSPTTLSAAKVGTNYSHTITAKGGTAPYSFTVSSGSLPPGLTLSSGGVLSGKPTAAGSYTFTVTATDSSTGTGPYSGSLSYTLVVNLKLSPTALSAGTVGISYTKTITASGGTAPYTFAVTTGSLPPGLTLTSSGLLSGTPTTAGSFKFTVTATDSKNNTGSQAYTFTVKAPAPALADPGTVNDGPMLAAAVGTAPDSPAPAPMGVLDRIRPNGSDFTATGTQLSSEDVDAFFASVNSVDSLLADVRVRYGHQAADWSETSMSLDFLDNVAPDALTPAPGRDQT